MQVNRQCYPPEYFLSRLGMFGPTYAQSSISRLKSTLRPPLPLGSLDQESEMLVSSRNCLDCRVPDHLCKTLRHTAEDVKTSCRTSRASRAQSVDIRRQCRVAESARGRRCTSPDIAGHGLRAVSPRCRQAVSPNRQRGRAVKAQWSGPHNIGQCIYPVQVPHHVVHHAGIHSIVYAV